MSGRSSPSTASGAAAFTLRYQLAIHGMRAIQTQYATARYVITDVADQRLLFDRARGARFAVDSGARTLRPIDDAAQAEQGRQLREELGEVAAERDEPGIEIAGFPCSRFSVRIDHPRIVASGELFVARLPGVEHTALADDRAIQARAQPFVIPLEPGEIVVSSRVRLLAQHLDIVQKLTLESVERTIQQRDRLEACLGFSAAQGVH